MIRADAFYAAFHAAFAPGAAAVGLRREGRRGAKWRCLVAENDLRLAFRVNPKASAIPGYPSEFWPAISWSGARYNARDDGTISYYQYATDAEMDGMQAMRRAGVEKAAARDPLRLGGQVQGYLQTFFSSLDFPLRPQHPHVGLYYFDEADAGAWGNWFGNHVGEWLRRFAASPETLESWCWRVLWAERSRTA